MKRQNIRVFTIFSDDFLEVLGTEDSINTFSQDNVIGRDVELYSVFNGCKEINLNVNIAGTPHTRDYTFFFGHTGGKMDVVSGHSLEAFFLDEFPEFCVCSVNDSGVHFRVFNGLEQLFGTDLLNGMPLSGSNVDVLAFIFEFESFFVVGLDNGLDVFEVDVFVAFVFFEVFHNVVYFDKSSCIHL